MHRRITYILTFILFFLISTSSGITIIYREVLNNQYLETIYIDPGHGGSDGGTTSSNGLTIEKDITLKVSFYVKEYLERNGYRVYMTRKTDHAIAATKKEDIHKRVKLINESNAILYLSIHVNGFPSPNVHGAQTFYSTQKEENKILAEDIMAMLKLIDSTNNRVAKSLSGKYIIDNANKIGCLVELGFLTNDKDLKNLTNDEYLQRISMMIFLGVINFLEKI